MRAKEFVPASKPRNFVAKNQKTAGAGAHKDKKRAEKQGDVKHKGKQFDEGVVEGSLNEGQYEMMLRNGQVKKFVAKDDADAKRIAAGHGAKSVIKLKGGVPAGKIAGQGVAEGFSNPQLEAKIRARLQQLQDIDPDNMYKIVAAEFGMSEDELRNALYDESIEMERVRDPEDWDEGNTEPPNNFAIYINGKKWKVFQGRGTYADDEREMKQYYDLKAWCQKKSIATGKKWEVSRTGEPATA